MRASLTAIVLFVCFASVTSVSGQQSTSTATAAPPSSDPQALTALRAAVAAMGGGAPSDSTAIGTISITAGTRTESGTFTLLTRGIKQSSEKIAASYTNQSLIYSSGWASVTNAEGTQGLSIEASLSSQSAIFPLPFLLNALDDATLNCHYFGLETSESGRLLHVQFWHAYANRPGWQPLRSFTVVDVWLDAASSLPQRVSYVHRDAGGDAPALTVDVFFSDYRNYGGILYPMTIQESWNGTPWALISLRSVALNSGLTDSDFPVEKETK